MSKNFQPDSLHPYIMDARLKKATGSGGISNIPIASADTVGGIKVPDNSGITIDGSGNAYAYKPINYSTNEVNTGRKWIDGKDIYEKVVVLENAISVSTSWTDLSISNAEYDVMVHANGIHADGSCYPLILDLHNSEQATTLYAKASASIDVKTLVFEYTKPTP